MLDKLTSTPGGKAGVIAVVILAVGLAVFEGIHVASAAGPQYADPKQVQSAAEKQVEIIEKENLPPAIKEEMLAHYRAMAQGKSPKGAGTGPPSH